jgi:thiol-disulfide isomerase/thioredoxin
MVREPASGMNQAAGNRGGDLKPLAAAVFFLMASAVLFAHTALAADQEPIPWRDDYLAALRESVDEGRPVYMYFSAEWCAPCRKVEATTYRDAEVVDALQGLVPLKVEYFAGSGLANKFQVVAIPTLIVIDQHAEVIARRLGYHLSQEVLGTLRAVHDGYREYLTDLAAVGDFAASRRVAAFLVKVGNTARAVTVLESGLKGIPKTDVSRRTLAQIDVLEARELDGDLAGAASLYTKVSNSGPDRDLRAKALFRLASVERRRGRPGKASEALDRLAREYPDLSTSEALRGQGLAD